MHVDWLLQPSVFTTRRFDKNINSANCSAVDYPVLPFTAYILPLKRFMVPEVLSTVLLSNTDVISLKPVDGYTMIKNDKWALFSSKTFGYANS